MKIKATYLACDYEDGFPIITADSFENIREALDDYCGADHRNIGKYIDFHIYETKYPNDYMGYMEYECLESRSDSSKTFISKFKIYCLEFYPLTKIEENKIFDNPTKEENKTSFGEISDEEIEKASNTLGDYYASELIMWENGAKWYREQLKLKKFKTNK
jgi:hypothetical protein